MARELTHLDEQGRVRMVDVGEKDPSLRVARAFGQIRMRPETIRLIVEKRLGKGNVLETARLAGIMAAKRTDELIPLCHSLNLTGIEISFTVGEDRIGVETEAHICDRTGVEMEALVAASVALLTVYDMCKAADRDMVISEVRLLEKRGGRSGVHIRGEGSG